jgi:hypothetical protein
LSYNLNLPLLRWENQKHQHLRGYREFGNHRYTALQAQKNEQKNHRKPLPSRAAQPLKPVGQNEELLWRHSPDIRRLSARTKARHREKS